MIHKVFCVYDSKAESYGMPMFLKSSAEAIRSFTDAVGNPDSILGKHPADFTLFEIGEYNQLSGLFERLSTPKSLGVLVELLPKV